MLTDSKILSKVQRLETIYAAHRFESIASLSLEACETRQHLRSPKEANAELTFQPVATGHRWGDDQISAWFRTRAVLPSTFARGRAFLRIETGGPEALLFINGLPRGVFDTNHPVRLLTLDGVAGEGFDIYLEAYAGHNHPGTQPFNGVNLLNDPAVQVTKDGRTVGRAELLIEREDVSAFVFELRALHQLAAALEPTSLRRGKLYAAMAELQQIVFAKPEEAGIDQWRPALAEARKIMRPLLESRNGPTAPSIGVIGHSHIDTAWLWPIRETWRKCARTFGSVLALMDQYPEFKFTQSAPYHAETIRKLYPNLFDLLKQRVADGRWEINGAMWIEPDCNIPSGESLARQCLFGQRATREMFGVTSDTLWQPDVFGYSAALPQILRQAGVEFFCTTKLSWNDTNKFPYDTFYWQGIDGSKVLSHFNTIHCWPDPKTLTEQWAGVQHNDVQDRRLMAFGFGDGGGGPMAEMIEMARLTQDLEACPKAEYRTITQFMRGCRDELPDLPTWVGELYLELHRGTLTSIAALKRANRKCEFALRDAELLATFAGLTGKPYPHEKLRDTWKLLLLNQFHDILPGSAIAEVNDEAKAAYETCERQADEICRASVDGISRDNNTTSAVVLNSLSWKRSGEVELTGLPPGTVPAGAVTQAFVDIDGTPRVAAVGLELPALSYRVLPLTHAPAKTPSPFKIAGNVISTPFARITLGNAGEITGFYDTVSRRELVRPGMAFNQLLVGEDVPNAWDNWDIDRDQTNKLRPNVKFVDREIVADGPLQLRLRTRYTIGHASTMTQDTVFHATTPRVDFVSLVDWHEKYQLLKTSFGVAVHADTARHEMQFGHVTRPTHDNTSWDRARFDVCAHKWTDLSETGYGITFLNDCKYACTIKDGDYRLTLIKSGRHPDSRGDAGTHRFAYAILPHAGGFSAEAVIRPAYEFNLPPRVLAGSLSGGESQPILSIDRANVIVEAVKRAEDSDAVIIRLYEAEGTGGYAKLMLGRWSEVHHANLLEEPIGPVEIDADGVADMYFRPFEIKTLLCRPAVSMP